MRPDDESGVTEKAGPPEHRLRYNHVDNRLNERVWRGGNKFCQARVDFLPRKLTQRNKSLVRGSALRQ
jgi:hypothetical protein